MRTHHALAAGAVALALSGFHDPAQAQARKAAATTRYLTLDGVTFSGASVPQFEANLRLALTGGKVSGGSIDGCIGTDPLSLRVDRFVADLDAKGDVLRASGTTGYGGKPWTMEVKAAKAGADWKVDGKVEYAGKAYPFHGEDIPAMDGANEPESEDEPPADLAPDGRSLNRVDVTVPIGKLAEAVGVLRERGGSLSVGRLLPGCSDLRAGHQTVTVVAAPEAADALVKAMGAVPGLKARMADELAPTNRVRVASDRTPARYGEDGERPLADRVAEAMRAALPGSSPVDGPKRSAVTGRWMVSMERPSALDPALGLRERNTLAFVIGRSATAADRAIVSLDTLTTRLVPDPAKAGRLVVESPEVSGEESLDTDLATGPASEAIRDALARATGGEAATGDNGEWQPVR